MMAIERTDELVDCVSILPKSYAIRSGCACTAYSDTRMMATDSVRAGT